MGAASIMLIFVTVIPIVAVIYIIRLFSKK